MSCLNVKVKPVKLRMYLETKVIGHSEILPTRNILNS